jgi:hypothetical protein
MDAYDIVARSTIRLLPGTRCTQWRLAYVALERLIPHVEGFSAEGALSWKMRFKTQHLFFALRPHRPKPLWPIRGPPFNMTTLHNGLFATRRLDHVVQYHRTCQARGAFQPTDG